MMYRVAEIAEERQLPEILLKPEYTGKVFHERQKNGLPQRFDG